MADIGPVESFPTVSGITIQNANGKIKVDVHSELLSIRRGRMPLALGHSGVM